MSESIIIFGAGGHARVVASIVQIDPRWKLAGVLDRSRNSFGETIGETKVVGDFNDADRFFREGVRNAALAIGENKERSEWFNRLREIGFAFPVLRHPSALVLTGARLGAGTLLCAGVIVGVQTTVGEAVIINTGAIIDHESVVGDGAHLAPGCRVAGRVEIGSEVFLGIGSVVRDKIKIGARTIVGAGAVVIHDLPANVTAVGCPARVLQEKGPAATAP